MKAPSKCANDVWPNLSRRRIALALYRPHAILGLVVSIDVNTAVTVAGGRLVNHS